MVLQYDIKKLKITTYYYINMFTAKNNDDRIHIANIINGNMNFKYTSQKFQITLENILNKFLPDLVNDVLPKVLSDLVVQYTLEQITFGGEVTHQMVKINFTYDFKILTFCIDYHCECHYNHNYFDCLHEAPRVMLGNLGIFDKQLIEYCMSSLQDSACTFGYIKPDIKRRNYRKPYFLDTLRTLMNHVQKVNNDTNGLVYLVMDISIWFLDTIDLHKSRK